MATRTYNPNIHKKLADMIQFPKAAASPKIQNPGTSRQVATSKTSQKSSKLAAKPTTSKTPQKNKEEDPTTLKLVEIMIEFAKTLKVQKPMEFKAFQEFIGKKNKKETDFDTQKFGILPQRFMDFLVNRCGSTTSTTVQDGGFGAFVFMGGWIKNNPLKSIAIGLFLGIVGIAFAISTSPLWLPIWAYGKLTEEKEKPKETGKDESNRSPSETVAVNRWKAGLAKKELEDSASKETTRIPIQQFGWVKHTNTIDDDARGLRHKGGSNDKIYVKLSYLLCQKV